MFVSPSSLTTTYLFSELKVQNWHSALRYRTGHSIALGLVMFVAGGHVSYIHPWWITKLQGVWFQLIDFTGLEKPLIAGAHWYHW